MYIIVVGAGKVGYYLIRELLETQQEVLLIEQSPMRCAEIAQELGDAVVMQGDGCEASTLERAGATRADLVIAVTGDDEDNLVVCQVAKHRFNVPRAVARVNNPKNELIFRKLGIDTTVSATSAILAQIEQELPIHTLIPLMTLKGSGLEIVEVKVPPDAAVVGKPIRDLLLPHQCLITLIVNSDGQPRVPNPETIIHPGDEIVAVTLRETESSLRAALTSASPLAPGAFP